MQCYSPMSIERPGGRGATDRVTVECGKCLACLQNKRANWSMRLYEESKIAHTAYFVTLTYSDETLPYHPIGQEFVQKNIRRNKSIYQGYQPTLDKTELQKYFKKLRHANEGQIKYYAIGEYGSLLCRPHYHIILFNVDYQADVISSWTTFNRQRNTYDLRGKVDIGKVEPASIHYVTNYQIGPLHQYGEFQDKTKQEPFQLFSKGLGENYVIDNYSWHHYENRFYMIGDKGHKQKMPRYYKEKLMNVRQKIDFNKQMTDLEDQKHWRDKTQNQIRDTKKAHKLTKHKL